MKRLLTAPFLFSLAYIFIFAALRTTGQTKKDSHRYFEVLYFGQDSTYSLKYGTYYFTTNGAFPSKEEVQKVIIDGYKLQFSYHSNKLAIILKEFKNEDEYNKFNHPL